MQLLINPFSWFWREQKDDFLWALRDISFDVDEGEVVGVIGRNGAGKSTLLKLLSRITRPTKGYAKLYGRVGSLLEVGTGFHPELTGRENIYLSGTILGMRREEVKAKFDAIVDFAGIEPFLNTPVKHYSSGMYVRLGFSIAAHLEPEILLVDEVLAVGDIDFQKKCLGKIGKIVKAGRTVLFVSHNLGSIAQLCEKVILLEKGQMISMGSASSVIEDYAKHQSSFTWSQARQKDEICEIRRFELIQNESQKEILLASRKAEIVIEYELKQRVVGFHIYVQLVTIGDLIVWESLHDGALSHPCVQGPGIYQSCLELPANIFNRGPYFLRLFGAIHNVRRCDIGDPEILLNIVFDNCANRAYPGYVSPGVLLPYLRWQTRRLDTGALWPQEDLVS